MLLTQQLLSDRLRVLLLRLMLLLSLRRRGGVVVEIASLRIEIVMRVVGRLVLLISRLVLIIAVGARDYTMAS